MKKLLIISLCIIFFSCFKSEIIQYETANQNPFTFNTGQQLTSLSASNIDFCVVPKACKFLSKYDGSIWGDVENYYSDFSDIKFLNITYFISFFNLDNDISYCKGWKKGENIYDGIKWDIKIKKDEWDEFWFDYDYYGTSDEIEYSITYKYAVIDSLLHFSRSDDQTFIFHPSDKNYLKNFVDTGEIIEQQGCMFY
jgi:hypothetical protein